MGQGWWPGLEALRMTAFISGQLWKHQLMEEGGLTRSFFPNPCPNFISNDVDNNDDLGWPVNPLVS